MEKLLVLLVEDHDINGRYMKELLECEDFEVIWTKDLKTAEEAYKLHKNDLKAIILDGHLDVRTNTLPLIKYIKDDGFEGLMLATSEDPILRIDMMKEGCSAHCFKRHFLHHLLEVKNRFT